MDGGAELDDGGERERERERERESRLKYWVLLECA
jgi:hypothetical protein